MKHTILFKVTEASGEFQVEADTLEDALVKAREIIKKPFPILKFKSLGWNDFTIEIDGVLG